MTCPKCGKEVNDTNKFCGYCGAELMKFQNAMPAEISQNAIPVEKQQNVLPWEGENNSFVKCSNTQQSGINVNQFKKGKNSKTVLLIALPIIAIAILFVSLFRQTGYDSEYTNNDGNKLPIVVTNVEISSDNYGDCETTFYFTNKENIDYKYAKFAVLAWDKNGFPLKFMQAYAISDFTNAYVEFFTVENLSGHDSQSCTIVYDFDYSEIQYMSVFLISYEDFSLNTWESPIIEQWDKVEGHKLEDTDIYYFEFESY